MDNHLYLKEISLKPDKDIDISVFPYNLKIIQDISKIKFQNPVTFIIGENGSGKSTILEAIAISLRLNPEGGNQNMLFSTSSTHSDLYQSLRVSKGIHQPKEKYFLRAESFYNVATEVDNYGVKDSYGGKSLHQQSHGESFLSLFMNKLRGNGLYILDEPEAALSPKRQMSLITRINDLIKNDSQFIIATHSPIILSYPYADIYDISNSQINKVKYEETEIFQITKMYLDHYQRMLNELLD